jgi:hypothetical protein
VKKSADCMAKRECIDEMAQEGVTRPHPTGHPATTTVVTCRHCRPATATVITATQPMPATSTATQPPPYLLPLPPISPQPPSVTATQLRPPLPSRHCRPLPLSTTATVNHCHCQPLPQSTTATYQQSTINCHPQPQPPTGAFCPPLVTPHATPSASTTEPLPPPLRTVVTMYRPALPPPLPLPA